MEEVYNVPASGRNNARILHFLGDWYMLSTSLDYFRYALMGHFMPSMSQYDEVCELCSQTGAVRVPDSNGTETSTSTSQDGL